jgi:hypothetical protein
MKTINAKPLTKQGALGPNAAVDRYAILQKRVEDLERLHADEKKSV